MIPIAMNHEWYLPKKLYLQYKSYYCKLFLLRCSGVAIHQTTLRFFWLF